jgi:hypothetical protein
MRDNSLHKTIKMIYLNEGVNCVYFIEYENARDKRRIRSVLTVT